MVRKLSALAVFVGALLAASAAHAQTATRSFGSKGEFIFSADRLFPVLGYSNGSATEPGTPPAGVNKIVDTDGYSSLGFFWGETPAFPGAPGSAPLAGLPNVYTVPRAGFDYTIIPNVTIGGDVVLAFTLGGSTSSETYLANGNTSTISGSEPTTTIFGIAPRGGYILHLTDLLSLWLRGGLSYYTVTTKTSATNATNVTTTSSYNFDQLALDLDPQLVITPVQHFGFMVGVTGDFPITGGISDSTSTSGRSTGISSHASLLFVGVTSGLFAWF